MLVNTYKEVYCVLVGDEIGVVMGIEVRGGGDDGYGGYGYGDDGFYGYAVSCDGHGGGIVF